MSMLPSDKRLNSAGWICVAYALLSSILSIPYFLVPGFAHPVIRVLFITIQLLVSVAAIAAYVNLALLLNGPFRFRRANIPIGLAVGAVVFGTLFSLLVQLPGFYPALNFSPAILIGLSSASGILSALIHVVLALALRPLWKVVPRLNHFSYALLCFGTIALLASAGYWLPDLARLSVPLMFLSRFVTFILLAGVFFRAARMAKAGWSNALIAQAENATKSA